MLRVPFAGADVHAKARQGSYFFLFEHFNTPKRCEDLMDGLKEGTKVAISGCLISRPHIQNNDDVHTTFILAEKLGIIPDNPES